MVAVYFLATLVLKLFYAIKIRHYSIGTIIQIPQRASSPLAQSA